MNGLACRHPRTRLRALRVRSLRPLRFLFLPLAFLALTGCGGARKTQDINYPDGSLQARWSLRQVEDNWVPDGPYVELHPGGEKSVEGSFKAGEKNGTWKSWYPGGQIESETGYRNGRRHGASTIWWPGGGRQMRETYRDGTKHGPETHWYANGYREWEGKFDNGTLVSFTRWSADGREVEHYTPKEGIMRRPGEGVPAAPLPREEAPKPDKKKPRREEKPMKITDPLPG